MQIHHYSPEHKLEKYIFEKHNCIDVMLWKYIKLGVHGNLQSLNVEYN